MNWRDAIRVLAQIERPSASAGERRAAELIAGWLGELGCRTVVEEERAHGGYWWPIGSANAVAAACALLSLRRGSGHVIRLTAWAGSWALAAALWDDLGHGRRWFRRALFRRRPTWNVVAETGDRDAHRVVALIAHHDAAHSGLVFHPALARIGPRLLPRVHARASHTLPILYGVWLGPVVVGLAALARRRTLLRAGALLAAGATAIMLDIGARSAVPGANDNLSAVGVLIGLAQALQDRPVQGVRVLLISTGSEESFSEGMQAFGARHFGELPRACTEFICLECLGGSQLNVLEGEGMLKMRDYPPHMRESLADAAVVAGVSIGRGLRTVAATDAIIALRAGYDVVTLASVEGTKLPLNYHWPSDVPDALHWETIEAALGTCESFLRSRALATAVRQR